MRVGFSKRLVRKLKGRVEQSIILNRKEVEETNDCDNECDPHKKIEASEYVVENLLPVLSLWGGYNILPKSVRQASDSRRFKTNSGGGGEPLVDQINGDGMDVDLTDSICLVRSCL